MLLWIPKEQYPYISRNCEDHSLEFEDKKSASVSEGSFPGMKVVGDGGGVLPTSEKGW